MGRSALGLHPPSPHALHLLPPWGWSVLAQQTFPGLLTVTAHPGYLGLGAARLPQTLTGHLNRLVCSGKLCGLHQPLLSSLAIGVRHTNQICSLEGERNGVRNKEHS